MIKSLIIYYSFEGNTRLMAESMAQVIRADLLPLVPEKEIESKGFSKYLWGGGQVMMKRKPALQPFQVNPLEYDLILIGTPVWAWTYSPPVATLLHSVDFTHKCIGLFTCHGGQNAKTFHHMRKLLENSIVLGEIDFFEPLTKGREQSILRAEKWASEMVSACEARINSV